MPMIARLVAACAATVLTSLAGAQSALTHPVGQILPFSVDTGTWDNAQNAPVRVFSDTVHIEGSAWLRLYFADTNLPDGSYIQITSLLDGETQILDRKTMYSWSETSAYFNGSTVVLEVFAGPATFGTHVKVRSVGVEYPIQPVGDPGRCGICGEDDRVQANELWSGRILPKGCTGSVYCTTGSGIITSGHCLDGPTELVVEFNVPNSGPDCSLSHPPVADQFPVQPGFQFRNAGPGDNWGVCRTGLNSLGQTPFQRYGQFRPLATAPMSVGQSISFWGYGGDTNCVRNQTQQLSTGPISVVSAEYYRFFADVTGGTSGAACLNAAGEIVGVVTHCSSGCPNSAQRVDDAEFVSFRNAVNPNCGTIPPPANDNCANAIAMGIGNVSGDTSGATADGSPCGLSVSPDVWYSFTPSCSGTFLFSTCGGAVWDTSISVHTGCPGTFSNALACSDDVCGVQSQVIMAMTAGTTYLIRVGGTDLSSFGAFTLTSSILSLQGPANDFCANAQPIGLGAVPGTTGCANTEGITTCGFNTGLDVWYSFTPTCSGTYTFDTCGPRNFDTVLSLYGSCGGAQIDCNDDTCGLGSRISTFLSAGSTSFIRVAGHNQQAGSFTLNVTRGADTSPANDNCANALPIAVGGTASGSTTCATNDGIADCASSATSNDVWYAFTADCTAFYVADTLGSNYDTALSVHSGCPGTLANLVACDDDSAGSLLSRAVWQQTAGTTYYIRVNGYNNNSGNYTFNVGNLPNDAVANPLQLFNGTVGFSNRGATTDGSPEGICNAFGDSNVNGDVWFYYYAQCNGTVDIDLCGSSFDTKLAVYNGYSSSPTGPFGCNDDSCSLQSRVTFSATAGQLFQIRVGGFGADRGCGLINVSCTNPCPWQADGCFGDFNNDSGIDGDDVIAFFSDWDSNGSCADVNNDGGTDGDDVILFFNSWDNAGIGFPGC